MKNFYFLIFTLLLSNLYKSQIIDLEKKSLIQREAQNYLSLLDYNVNPNTLNYNLKYQRLEAEIDPSVNLISGKVTSYFIPNTSISKIYFDFTNLLTVSQVSYHGNNLSFQQLSTKELIIDFPSTISANTLDSLSIQYSGAPANSNAFKTGLQNNIPIVSTLSEPYGAQDWFPTKQSLNDKIEQFDFKITTPSLYDVAANGKLMSVTNLPNNKKLTFWRTLYPMASYLAAISITDFDIYNDVIGNPPFPFVNYVYASSSTNSNIMGNIDWTKQVLPLFETYFGAYPFRNEKYGHMEFNFNGTCMEHQTMSSMSSWGKYVIAHELAHQWFGDKITCKTWNDIWLNEGFATFGEHLANEKLLMNNTDFLNYLLNQKNYITSVSNGSTYVSDANLGNIGSVFNGRLSYAKGGYILRMLKWILGDANFYTALQDYQNRPNLAYNYAETSDFKQSLLQSTGKDFTYFFNQWLYGEGYPTYSIKWNQISGNPSMFFLVSQTQSHPSVNYFQLPLPIKVTGTQGETAYLKLENTLNNQYFNIPVNFTVANVEFNYDYQIIEKNSVVINDASLSTKEFTEQDQIILYPNPAKNEIYLKGLKNETQYHIYSMDGKLIKNGNTNSIKPIDISYLPIGSYIISINSRHLKFIKK